MHRLNETKEKVSFLINCSFNLQTDIFTVENTVPKLGMNTVKKERLEVMKCRHISANVERFLKSHVHRKPQGIRLTDILRNMNVTVVRTLLQSVTGKQKNLLSMNVGQLRR